MACILVFLALLHGSESHAKASRHDIDLARADEAIRRGRVAEAEGLARFYLPSDPRRDKRSPSEIAPWVRVLARCAIASPRHTKAEAIQLADSAYRLAERAYGADDLRMVDYLRTMAAAKVRFGRDTTAAEPLHQALALLERRSFSHSLKAADCYEDLTLWWSAQGDFARAESSLVRAYEIRRDSLGEMHRDVASVYRLRAQLAMSRMAPADALIELRRALTISEGVPPVDSSGIASALMSIAAAEQAVVRMDTARVVLARAMAIDERFYGPESKELGLDRRLLGTLELNSGNPTAARAQFVASMRILERCLGPGSGEWALSLGALAYLQASAGASDSAIVNLSHAIALLEEEFSSRNIRIIWHRTILGQLVGSTKDPRLGEQLGRHALANLEQVMGPDNPAVIGGYTSLAGSLLVQGELDEADRLIRARALRADSLGLVTAAEPMNLLGVIEIQRGLAVEARGTLERALELTQRANAPNPQEVRAIILNNLGRVHQELGDFPKAREHFERVLELRRSTLGDSSPALCRTHNNLAHLALITGDTASARKHVDAALRLLGDQNQPFDRSAIVSTHAWLELACGNLAHASNLYRAAMQLVDPSSGGDPALWSLHGAELSAVLVQMGALDQAKALLDSVLVIRTETQGASHPVVANTLESLGIVSYLQGDLAGAMALAVQAEQVRRDHLRLAVRHLPERQAIRYVGARTGGLDLALSVAHAQPEYSKYAVPAWDAVIRSRSLVLDEIATRNRSLLGTTDSLTALLADSLRSVSTRLANLSLREPGADLAARSANLAEVASEQRKFQRRLAERSAAFRALEYRDSLGHREVAASLRPGQALLAYVEFDALDPAHASLRIEGSRAGGDPTTRRLAAFVQLAGQSQPQLVPLGPWSDVRQLVERWRTGASVMGATEKMGRPEGNPAAALREAVWDPVARLFEGATELFIVPTGALHLVNFGALPSKAGHFLMESPLLLRYLSAERDLIPSPEARRSTSGLLALGAVDYDQATAPDTTSKPTRPSTEPNSLPVLALRSPSSPCNDPALRSFRPLPATADELVDARALWRPVKRPGTRAAGGRDAVRILSAEAATEESFKRWAPGRQVVHLATHAYFVDPDCGTHRPASSGSTDSVRVLRENPLLSCGLALAGANQRGQAGTGGEDGILTAEEIALLDLSGVDLALLSACETGLGVIEGGEGVFGLRRAFAVAGAGDVVMSLWKVEDSASRQWVGDFYRSHFQRGLSTAAATRQASLELLATLRRSGVDPSPALWGAFIVTENHPVAANTPKR